MTPKHLKTLSAAALVALALGTAVGQTANPSTGVTAAAKEEAIELTPFTVTSDKDVGYQAANTLAGSRMNTSLKDTAASISILTSEFIKDVGALDLTEAIAFGNNVEMELPDGNAAFEFYRTFVIRGQASSVARNYFRWKLPTNTFNIERIEEARGPNSILFGIASAGGLLNTSTKQAQTGRSFRGAQLVYGIYDLRRASVDLNQSSFNGKLGVRFNAVTSKEQAYQHFAKADETRGHVALKFDLTPETIIRAEYEKGKTSRIAADNTEVGDNVMRWFNAGRPVQRFTATNNALGVTLNSATTANLSVNLVDDGRGGLVNFDARGQGITQADTAGLITDPRVIDSVNYRASLGGPSQSQDSKFDTYSISIDRKFWKGTYLQAAYNHQNYDFEAWQASNPTGMKGDPNQFLRDGVTPNPNAGRLYFETYWTNRIREEASDNFRFTASQEFNFGKWGDYRFAGLAEREVRTFYNQATNEAWIDEATNQGAFGAAPNGSANRVLRRHYVTLLDQNTYYASPQHPTTTGGFMSGVADPSNPARRLKTRLVPSGASAFDDPSEQDSYLFAAQAYYFKRRLVLAGGYRTDTLYLHEGARGVVNPATQEFIIDNVNNKRTNRTLDAKTKTAGVVFHTLPWLSLRYNRSDSIELANTGVRLMPKLDSVGLPIGATSRVGNNPKGEGQDYGVDLNLLDGRIFVRATRFTTTRVGAQGFVYGGTVDNPTVLSDRILGQLVTNGLLSAAERERHRINSGGYEFDVASTGYEYSVTANPTRNWRLQANYSTSNPVSDNIAPEIQAWAATEIPFFKKFDQNILITSVNTTIAAEIARWELANTVNRSVTGLGTAGNRKEKASVVTNYSFREGLLKGVRVGGTARHQGKQVIGATTAGSVLYGNSFTRMDAWLGYSFGKLPALKLLKNVNLQLNVYNVLNQHDPLITRPADPNAAVVVYNRMAPQLPISWRFSADLSF